MTYSDLGMDKCGLYIVLSATISESACVCEVKGGIAKVNFLNHFRKMSRVPTQNKCRMTKLVLKQKHCPEFL